MSDDLDPRILAKWLAGILDPGEQAALEGWLAADPARAVQLDQARELWRRAGDVARAEADAPDPEEPARWAGILGAIRAGEGARAHRAARALTLEIPTRRRWVERWVAAAVLAVLAGGGIWASTHVRTLRVAEAPRPWRTYETARGERAEFRLADGTRVMLNVASRLRVPADFGDRTRNVYLDGGAYFEVVHDSTRLFTVHAGDIVARDLGTEFTVGAYPEQRHARVVVRKGLVALLSAAPGNAAAGDTLRPGQQGRLDDNGTPKVQRADTTGEFAWTGGTLVFDGTPLRAALPQLGRWFDLEFHLSDDSLGRIQLAATLTNQPTDDALRFLAASLGLRAERRGRVVTFYPGLEGKTP
jgi:transmembrane sensor